MADRRENTELERCVLGVVWLRGPCTTYVVRHEFLRSPTPHWSGSAGAIYPVVARLEEQSLIRAEAQSTTGGRKKTVYTITPEGLDELRRWVGPPLPEWTAAPTYDPIRVRASFLGAISPAMREKFVAAAEAEGRRSLETVRNLLDQSTDLYDRMSLLGALFDVEARLQWLSAIRPMLNQKRPAR